LSYPEAVMEQQLHRYFCGGVAFAFVVTWVTLGATDAVVALLLCLAGTNFQQLLRLIDATQLRARSPRRPQRSRLAARPLRAEYAYELVPDDPSLIISIQS
jgi:hypothetical protein